MGSQLAVAGPAHPAGAPVDGAEGRSGASTGAPPAGRGRQLRVVGGLHAGAVRPLAVGTHDLAPACQLVVTDAGVVVRAQGCDLRLDGKPVEGRATVAPGQVLHLGDTLMTIAAAPLAEAAVEVGDAGSQSFVRPPRLLPSHQRVRLSAPDAPADRMTRRFPLAAVVAPLLLGLGMAAVSRHPTYLLLALLSPVMVVSNAMSERRSAARGHRAALARFAAESAALAVELDDALCAEAARRREAHPDPAAVLLTATLPGCRLWERRGSDPDALVLRVGTRDLPAEVVIEPGRAGDLAQPVRPVRPSQPQVADVPVVVPLREVGVLAVTGPADPLSRLLHWLVLQVAVHSAPRDVALTLLAPAEGAHWSFVRWLPHTRADGFDGSVTRVGNNSGSVAARIAELLALISEREEQPHGGVVPPDHVVVVDGYRALRTTPGLARVLQDGPAVGVYAICADEDAQFLPESAGATLQLAGPDGVMLQVRRSGDHPVPDVLTDGVSTELAEDAARSLGPLTAQGGDVECALPTSVRLVDLLALDPPMAEGVRSRWASSDGSASAVLGAGPDGPFALDLRRDGPHALIAGTTGSGKSELLQSLLASLAATHPPDQLSFVLVDYKGGSAFRECAALPHTVGLVTDLDAQLAERALASLGAELKARERCFAEAGVKDLEEYRAVPGRPAVPRLLIVIDEFAALVRELPTFVPGLVDLAQRGRSLGLHLILATQRPSGVVSADIRANTNLRICLRVTDPADSSDVVRAPDAARLPTATPGRGLALLGDGPLVPFQAGRIGGRRAALVPAAIACPQVDRLPWTRLGDPVTTPSQPDDVPGSDLSDLVAAVRAACATLGLARRPGPWLAPLPERVLLSSLDPPEGRLALPFGLHDLPVRQQQRTAAFDLATDGHLLVVGSAGSGRTQLLRTLAASVAAAASRAAAPVSVSGGLGPHDLHVYGLDCGGGGLQPLEDLPSCGAVVRRTQPERAGRLLSRFQSELSRRQALLSDGGYADIGEQRRRAEAPDRLPHLLLLVDSWEGFTATLGEVDGGRLIDGILGLLREGASVGLHLVVTGDRSLATSRLASLTDRMLVLRLHDRADYALVGLAARAVPDVLPPGRAIDPRDGTHLQIALLTEDDAGRAQAAALSALAGVGLEQAVGCPATRPFRVDDLPTRISVEQAAALRPPDAPALLAVVGVGGDELRALGPDLGAGTAFVVAGPARSGRSTVLVGLARGLTARGITVLLAAPRPSPLRELAGEPGVLAVVEAPDAPGEHWRALLESSGSQPLVLLLDDAEVLRDVPAATVFLDVVKGALPGRSLVLAGHADGLCLGLSGWQAEARRARQGLLLSPQSVGDGDLIGVRLPRSATGLPVQPGRGLLHLGDGRLMTVTVPG